MLQAVDSVAQMIQTLRDLNSEQIYRFRFYIRDDIYSSGSSSAEKKRQAPDPTLIRNEEKNISTFKVGRHKIRSNKP